MLRRRPLWAGAQALLQKVGMRVTTAKDGLEGLEKLTDPTAWVEGQEPPFLFALVDMSMPGMDGCEMVRRASAPPERCSSTHATGDV